MPPPLIEEADTEEPEEPEPDLEVELERLKLKDEDGGAVNVDTVKLFVKVVLDTNTPDVKEYDVVELVWFAKQFDGVVKQHGSV